MLAALTVSAAAHESRPLYIELNQTAPQRYQLQWKIPPTVPLPNTPTVTLSNGCKEESQLAEFSGPEGLVRRISYCCPKGLAGQSVAIIYPGPNPSVSSLIRYSSASGERHIA